MQAAPIALFAYKRPQHFHATLTALSENYLAIDSALYIFIDGPKNEVDRNSIEEVRFIARSIKGFKRVEIFESTTNKGLATSIIEGVSRILESHESVVVLEDDMVSSPFFLRYINQGLQVYHDHSDVISIHGYVYPVREELPPTFFLKGADCWGWATWKSKWKLFEKDGSKLLHELESKGLTQAFDFDGTYPYTQMLRDQVNGKVDSWAIRWYASAFLCDKYTLYPGKTLIKNIGLDGSGTHCIETSDLTSAELAKDIEVVRQPVIQNKEAFEAIKKFFKPEISKSSENSNFFNKIKKLFYVF